MIVFKIGRKIYFLENARGCQKCFFLFKHKSLGIPGMLVFPNARSYGQKV